MTDDAAQAEGEPSLLLLLRELGSYKAMRLSGIPSDRKLAQAAGVSPTTIGSWLHGDRFPQQIDQVLIIVQLIRAEADRRGIAHEQKALPALFDEERWRKLYLAEARRRAGTTAESM